MDTDSDSPRRHALFSPILLRLAVWRNQAERNGQNEWPLPPKPCLDEAWQAKTGLDPRIVREQPGRLALYGSLAVELVKSLPHNTVIRRELLRELTGDVPPKTVAYDFGVAQQTVHNARACTSQALLAPISAAPLRRARLSQDDLAYARAFLDEVIPVKSGTAFRVQTMTNDCLFATYHTQCILHNREPLGKTTFFETIVGRESIHHCRDASICDHCAKLNELKNLPNLTDEQQRLLERAEEHVSRARYQQSAYKEDKGRIEHEEDESTVVVLQDFTQVLGQGTFFQDFVVVLYFCDPEQPDTLIRNYQHFVAKSPAVKNDVTFVMRTWTYLMASHFFDGFDRIIIWSDGGPKHFKVTATINFFGWLQHRFGKKIIYNFFESNHGHSVCDTVAAQGKQILNKYQRDMQTPIKTSEQIVQVLPFAQGHHAELAPVDENEPGTHPATYRGIREMHQFKFTPETVLAYRLSGEAIPKHEWPYRQDVRQFLEEEIDIFE